MMFFVTKSQNFDEQLSSLALWQMVEDNSNPSREFGTYEQGEWEGSREFVPDWTKKGILF